MESVLKGAGMLIMHWGSGQAAARVQWERSGKQSPLVRQSWPRGGHISELLNNVNFFRHHSPAVAVQVAVSLNLGGLYQPIVCFNF